MKWLVTLLAVLVLFLSVQPVCAAAPGAVEDTCCEAGCPDATRESDGGTPQSGEDAGCKGCNPFQACACCASGVLIPAPRPARPLVVPLVPQQQRWSAYLVSFPAEVYADVWQPPRLV